MGPPPRPLPYAAAHAFVADLAAPVLDDDDRHHLERVLRLQPGQAVTVSDGRGGWRRCTWRGGGRVDPAGPEEVEAPADPLVTVAFALTKGERPEWVVQKLTEVGVDRIIPFRAARSVVRWDEEKAAGQAGRWRRVARQAAMQSRRARLPEVAAVAAFAEVVAVATVTAALAAPEGGPPSLDRPTLLVGPEGGWDEGELACGLPVVGLGPTVLRAETAAMAAAVLLCGLRNATVHPAGVRER
ncbi:MAG: RsmE family RNA methyltransferase [Acidimicrobiales bacterium]